MPPRSKIDSLPAEAREALDGWLKDPGTTQKEATRRVNELLENMGQGERRLSPLAVHRYDLKMRATDERNRQARVISEVWVDRFGSEPAGQAGQLVIEMLRTLTFDLALRLQNSELDDNSLPDLIEAAAKVTLMAQRLERLNEIKTRLEREIKREAEEERKAKAARKDKKSTKVNTEKLRQIVREIYGV